MNRLKKLLKFYQDNPSDSFIMFALAKEYEKIGEENQAFQYYQLLQKTDENYVGLYYHLGKLLERQAQPSEAFQTYSKGMEIAKKAGDQHAFSELAGARLILGDEEDFNL